ncbi:MAG: isoaspartyl peptidase/L-asparaginase [Alphaproteobacteria bacterium]|uniref:Isoaspartyl peptidase n=1 Tax=Candidatus Nitrobium versatile TaxID=2884831 RepID=A0A953J6B3_9BACT|nr:isoaspartyl peptidase/L-asparaginase [Candidatus Nitrobium versatile]
MLLLVHGGAGDRAPGAKALETLSACLSSGYEVLRSGGTALDAVVAAISFLEDSGFFNAGAGGNLQMDGVRRLDASLMEGRHLNAGSVIGLEGIRNPVRAARLVMDLPHVMLTNTGAKRIAEANGLAPLPEPGQSVLQKLARARGEGTAAALYERFFSTVGAVAVDGEGTLAAGASTGGVEAMLPGRVGDSPVIGAGIYADNAAGAVSCTGKGETILRLALGKEICMNMKTVSPSHAAELSLRRIRERGGEAGIIAVNAGGQFILAHTTAYMASGYADERGIVVREAFERVE